MTHVTMEKKVMTKKRSSDFWSRKVYPAEKILAMPMHTDATKNITAPYIRG